jgi:hypothetical protein
VAPVTLEGPGPADEAGPRRDTFIPTEAPAMAARKKKSPARSGRAGKARDKLADLPDLIPLTLVADKLGITSTILREWVTKGVFPEPHSIFEQTWLYRVDLIREFLGTGRWPDGTKFRGRRGEPMKYHHAD